MASKRSGEQAQESASRLLSLLASSPLHHMERPATVLDSELPAGAVAVLREFNGGELFQGDLVVHSSPGLAREEGRWHLASEGADSLWVDAEGRVWRHEGDSDDFYQEGARFAQWLAGWVDAQSLLYDREGEYLEELFDEDGELVTESRIRRERAILKRDRGAPGPRWRLARALRESDKRDQALNHLEDVVAASPGFAWAWFDLARLSEDRGELDGALQEMEHACAGQCNDDHLALFLAHQARLAHALGEESMRAECAGRVSALRPSLQGEHREAAEVLLSAGQLEQARELAELAQGIQPKDLGVHDSLRRIAAAESQLSGK